MPTTREFTLQAIGQVSVPVRDLDRALAFYRDVLGLRFLFQVPGMAFLDCGGVRLSLAVPTSDEFDHPASILYYRVADLDSAHAALASRGVRFETAPHRVAELDDHELWMAFLRDSEGNVLALMKERAKA